MNGADDTHTGPDRADAIPAPADGAEMDDDAFAAAAAAHDDRVMAAMMPGVVVVHADFYDLVRDLRARQQEKARRDADPRTADQMRAEVGVLLQRLYDARWYGDPDDVQRTSEELGRALRETQHRIAVPAESIAPGAYVRAVGRDPTTGQPQAVRGIVSAATHMSRREPGRDTGEEHGVLFVITPPQRDGHRGTSYELFVPDSVPLLELPVPVDRGGPDWMEHRGTTASHAHAADATSALPAHTGSASEPADAADHVGTRSPRPFPPPGPIDSATPGPTTAPTSSAAPARDRHR